MAIYNIQTKIKSNAECEKLSYTMQVYRYHNGQKQDALSLTPITVFQSDYLTQEHQSVDLTDEEAKALYILELQLYKDNGKGAQPLTGIKGTCIYCFETTQEVQQSYIEYYETSASTQKKNGDKINQFMNFISKKTRIFEAPEHPQNDPLDPFTFEIITASIQKRLPALGVSSAQGQQSNVTRNVLQSTAAYPDQGESSLCGAAAVFYCLQQDRPDLYRQIALDLWNRGETCLRDWSIKPSEGCRHPKSFFYQNNTPQVSPIDWLTLASLRDSENIFKSYDSPDDQFSGITDESTIKKWFKRFDFKFITRSSQNSSSHGQVNHSYKDNYDKLHEISVLNNYLAKDKHVPILINASLLGSSCQTLTANHWIVGTKPLQLVNSGIITDNMTLTNSILSEEIIFECFSWGDKQTITNFRHVRNRSPATLKDFLGCFYGGIIYDHII